MNLEQSIPCPTCGTKIPFDVHQLLVGVQFVCPGCSALIGLSNDSRETVKQTVEKFDEMREKVLKAKEDKTA